MSLNAADQASGPVTIVDPRLSPGWDQLLERFPQASVFYTRAWASVLSETYGHIPQYCCRYNGPRLSACLPVMEVNALWTGRRGVSLPFTDLCVPLGNHAQTAHDLYNAAREHGRSRRWNYLECRFRAEPGYTNPSLSFFGHVLDLTPGVAELFAGFSSAARRAVRKAELAGVEISFHTDPEAVRVYYQLHCLTRRRQGLPPQPFAFFQNIQKHLLEANQGFVAVASAGGRPIAGAVFLHFAAQGIYKFGASDETFQQLRPNTLLMWRSIGKLCQMKLKTLHFGRTSMGNEGLRRFKLGFGAREETLTYTRYDFRGKAFATSMDRSDTWVNSLFRLCPVPLLRLAGRLLYPQLS